MKNKNSYFKAIPSALAVSLLLVSSYQASAVTVTDLASDATGISSFNAAGNWSNGLAPQAGNDYVNAGKIMRTPATFGNYTFAGDSLTLQSGAILAYKGGGTTATLTINNLILDAGTLNGGPYTLAGNIKLLSGGGTFQTWSNGAGSTNITISAAISGAGKLSATTASNNGQQDPLAIILTHASNTYSGGTLVGAMSALSIQADGAMGTGLVTVQGGILGMGTNNNTVSGVILQDGTSASVVNAGSITGSGGVLTSTSNFDMRSGSVSAILGGGVGLTKSTSGTVTLSGANTYTGPTAVSAGKLVLNGSLAAGSAVSVASGATLAGSGTANGTVNVTSGTINGSGLTVASAAFTGASTLAGTTTATSGYTVASGTTNVTGNTTSTVAVSSGVLQGTGIVGNVALSSAASTLAGTLSTGALSGSGLVSPGNSPGILTTTSIESGNSLSFAFELATTTPNYASATNSLNDVLHVTNGSTGLNLSSANSISIYFSSLSASSLLPGMTPLTYEGGFFVDGLDAGALLSEFKSTNVTYFVLDNAGTTTFNGLTYSVFTDSNNAVSISSVSETTALGTGSTLLFTVVPEPSTWTMLIGGLGLLAFSQRIRRSKSC